MARKRPTASDASQIPANADAAISGGARPTRPGTLTEAQSRALRRCAPLSPAEFKAQREVIAQQHRWAVMRILRRADGPESLAVARRLRRSRPL